MPRQPLWRILSAATCTTLYLVSGPAVQAAPQILGLVASNGPVQLRCRDGTCSTSLSAFCMQQGRQSPAQGTVYHPVAVTDGVTLMVVDGDGRERHLPADRYLRFTIGRGYYAMTASLSEAVMADLGAVSARIVVGPATTLVPATVAGDRDPQSETDIALATKVLRPAARAYFDRTGAPLADATRLMDDMLALLPGTGRVSAGERRELWDTVVANGLPPGTSRAGRERAEQVFGLCRQRVDRGLRFSMRRCLEFEHDKMLMDINRDYWRGLGGV